MAEQKLEERVSILEKENKKNVKYLNYLQEYLTQQFPDDPPGGLPV